MKQWARKTQWFIGLAAGCIALLLGAAWAKEGKGEPELRLKLPLGLKAASPAAGDVELFGHVTLVEGYEVSGFSGAHALIDLRDTPGRTVAVLVTSQRLQSLLETGLTTGNLVAFRGRLDASPPTPLGGTWSVDVYNTYSVTDYNMR